MADSKNSKISQLDELVNPLDGDFLPIVDTAGQETKKISYSSLIAALNADDDSYSIGQTDTLLAVNAAAIAAEESRATAAEVANATNISTNATDIATNATAISTETTRATSAEGQLNTAIAAEITRAETAEEQLNTAIAAEITRAETAEEANETDIATNATNIATNATDIATNATAISTETTRAQNAETANATDITANTTAITTEETRALAAEALLAPIDDATFTGTTTIPSADITTADFNAGATGGELSWNGQEKTLNLVTGADTTIQVGQELVLYATNDSGATIPNGSVVSIDGSQGNKPTIILAQADTVANARKTIGITTESISDNSSGFVTLNGKVRDLVLDSGTYTEGEVVYLSSTVAGGITNIQPDISVELGHVLATSTGGNTGGVLEVQINNESAVHELEQTVPHNTDSVVICNDGDNIQDKYDEAALLTGNTKTLIVMAGTYGDLSITGDADVNVVGVGTVTIGDLTDDTLDVDIISSFKNFTCNSFSLGYVVRNIEDITTTSFFTVYETREDVTIKDITCGTYFKSEIGGNFGTIKNVNAATSVIVENNYGTVDNVNATGSWIHLSNDGTIKNCSGNPFLVDLYNYGIIDNCHTTGTNRGFGGYFGSLNSGTIKNCTATANLSFGQQDASGLTENCVCGGIRAFAGASNSINFSAGGIEGTYKNCKGGNESFFGRNTKTDAAVEMEATYENCTGGDKSFGFVESAPSGTVGPKTVFAGTAKNCTGGSSCFASSFVLGAQAEIKAGAVIENCTAKNKSFATHSDPSVNTCINYGNVIRSRCTGPSGFSATGTGKVRLCLDDTFTEINLG